MAMQVHVLCLLQYKHKAKCLMNWYWFPLNPLSNTNNESYPSTPPRLLQIMCQNTAGLLTMQHSPQTPSDGLLWVNSSVRVGTAISVNRWHYPCIQVLQHHESWTTFLFICQNLPCAGHYLYLGVSQQSEPHSIFCSLIHLPGLCSSPNDQLKNMPLESC